MPITLPCNCGRTLKLRDELAGKRIKCPSCAAILKVPEAEVETDFEVIESEPETDLEVIECEPARRADVSSEQITARRHEDRPRREEDWPRRDEERPRKKRRKTMRLSDDLYREFERERRRRRAPLVSISPAVISGVVMMVVAVVWFVLGLFVGWLFYYPPILFIFGLVAVVRGLMGAEEN
jgi:hypothetical protein